jgi:hypothetical protein
MPSNLGNKVDSKCLLKYLNMGSEKEPWIIQTEMRFNCFYKQVINQPLSSFTRAMELKCRSLDHVFYELFNIDYVECDGEKGYCMLFKDKNSLSIDRFRIYIPKVFLVNEIKARDIVAHELGHLYCAIMALEKEHSSINDSNYRKKNKASFCQFLLDYIGYRTKDKENNANIIASMILNKRVLFCIDKGRTEKALTRNFEAIVIALKNLK